MTFRQAIALGGCVRRGQKATTIVYANRLSRTEAGEDGQDVERSIPFLKAYGVTGDTLLLIRPDGYVAQIACRDIEAKMKSAVARIGPPTGAAAA